MRCRVERRLRSESNGTSSTRGNSVSRGSQARHFDDLHPEGFDEAAVSRNAVTLAQPITLFYRQVALRRGLPFEIKLPNETTRAAMRDAIEGKDLTEWSDLEELKVAHG